MEWILASASGNVFAFGWAREAPAAIDGAEAARKLCPRGTGLGVDGLFLLHECKAGEAWRMDHWDADGAYTFCSNGTRAALALAGSPSGESVPVLSSGQPLSLRRVGSEVGLRMPEGENCRLSVPALPLEAPAISGWIGNPQLVVEVPSVAQVELPRFAPPLRFNPAFPDGTNVNVLEVLGLGEARIRSWERGVEGETLCCGTGCAVAGAWLAQRTGCKDWRIQNASPDPVRITLGSMEGGAWEELWLWGPVRRIATVEPDVSLLL